MPIDNDHDSQAQTSRADWTPSSWKKRRIRQNVVYNDPGQVEKSLNKLRRLPPLVTPTEICRLRKSLRDVALGKAFLLQGGDCAELFDYCEQDIIESKIKLLLQMSLVLISGLKKPVVRIARIAGQYAKPRSSSMEAHQGRQIPSFRGDILNGYRPEDRDPDPARLVAAYFHSAATNNFIRASIASGIADLHSPLDWELGHVQDVRIKQCYEQIVKNITESLTFMRTVGADTAATTSGLDKIDLYTSHEALLLDYEESMTRWLRHPTCQKSANAPEPLQMSLDTHAKTKSEHMDPSDSDCGWYNTSAHFLWIGDRTRNLEEAHIEYIRGIENPIGIKVGPTMTCHELSDLLDVVNPSRAIGKVTLITRYGVDKIQHHLADHIRTVRATGHIVVWQCDPMHGNTLTTANGTKTRRFKDIFEEVRIALATHAALDSQLNGIHLELTGEPVTECLGGSQGLTEEHLNLNYTTYCDPRLNEKQALEMAFLLAGQHHVLGKGPDHVEIG